MQLWKPEFELNGINSGSWYLVPLLTNIDISLIVRGRLHSSCVRGSMLHGSETWPIRKKNEVAFQQAETRNVRWMCGLKLKDRVPSKELRERDYIHTLTQPFYGSIDLFRDNPGEPIPEEHSPTHTHHGHQSPLSTSSIYYSPWHLPYSINMIYSLFHNLSPSFLWSTSWPGTLLSYSIHFVTQSLPSFRNTCPYHRNRFSCSTEIMSFNPSQSPSQLFTWNSIL